MDVKFYKICLTGFILFIWNMTLLPQVNDMPGNINDLPIDNPGLSDIKLNKIGLEKLQEKHYSDAELLFLKAILKNPAVKYYYNNLSVVYMNQERYKEAYRNLKIAIRIDPEYVKALSNMAITCFYMFNFIESYKYYLDARKADREYTIRRFNKKKAELKIMELYKKNPDNESLGKILNRLEKYSD